MVDFLLSAFPREPECQRSKHELIDFFFISFRFEKHLLKLNVGAGLESRKTDYLTNILCLCTRANFSFY